MSSTSSNVAAASTRPPLGVIASATIGSALEWYDFFLYGTAAALVFGPLFFPKFDPLVGTLLSFATFGVGFIVRPFGGILFGYLGDKYGRKPVLMATLLLVGAGTMLIGCLPTYNSIGVWAPILLVSMRVIQGFGAGAEYGGAVILLVEYSPPGRRGFWGSFAPLGVSIGNLLAAGAFALASRLPKQQFMSWGWRIPFLLSMVLLPPRWWHGRAAPGGRSPAMLCCSPVLPPSLSGAARRPIATTFAPRPEPIKTQLRWQHRLRPDDSLAASV